MIKAVKKLKFWSRKNRKRKSSIYRRQSYYTLPPPQRPPPPPPGHCFCYYSTEPSAPPLPPWMDVEEYTHETLLAPQVQPAPAFAYHHHLPTPRQQEDEILNTNSNASSSKSSSSSSSPLYPHPTSSYQQYMAPEPEDPVYGVPVVQQTPEATTMERKRERIFGCVIDLGIRLFLCLCPCFRIREVILQ